MTEEKNQELKTLVLDDDEIRQGIIDQYMKDHDIDADSIDIIELVDLEEKIVTEWEEGRPKGTTISELYKKAREEKK